jgi:hypothetical protein
MNVINYFLRIYGPIIIALAIVNMIRGKSLSEAWLLFIIVLIVLGLPGALGFRENSERRLPTAPDGGQSDAAGSQGTSVEPPPAIPGLKDFRARTAALFRRMTIQLLISSTVWLAMVVMISLAGSHYLQGGSYAMTTGLARLGQLFWPCFLGLLIFDLIMWLALPVWAEGYMGSGWWARAAAACFALVPVVFGGLGAASLLLYERDPWECLPGGPPFALREFAVRHPGFQIESVGGPGGYVVAVTRNGSPWVFYTEGQLKFSDMTWDECRVNEEPMELGGPPAYPNSRCVARLQLINKDPNLIQAHKDSAEINRKIHGLGPDSSSTGAHKPDNAAVSGIRGVRYVYRFESANSSRVQEHFLAWAKTVTPSPSFSGDLRLTTGGRQWTIDVQGYKGSASQVYVEYTEP